MRFCSEPFFWSKIPKTVYSKKQPLFLIPMHHSSEKLNKRKGKKICTMMNCPSTVYFHLALDLWFLSALNQWSVNNLRERYICYVISLHRSYSITGQKEQKIPFSVLTLFLVFKARSSPFTKRRQMFEAWFSFRQLWKISLFRWIFYAASVNGVQCACMWILSKT